MTSLSTFDISTLYNTLPHNLVINVLILLEEPSIEKAFLTFDVTTETHSVLRKSLNNTMHGLVKRYGMR